MSILIKGMEMPVTCCHCPLMGYDPDIEWNGGGRKTQGAYVCVLTHELIDNTKREEHCPLVRVPPHGRLIDANALEYHADNVRDPMGRTEKTVMWKKIESAQTILPAEEGE